MKKSTAPRIAMISVLSAAMLLAACANDNAKKAAQGLNLETPTSDSQIALNEQRFQASLKKGYMALQNGDYENALSEFKLASLLSPNNPYAYINLGVIAQLRGNYPAARNYYELARSLPSAGEASPSQQASTDAMLTATPRAIAEANLRSLDQALLAQSTPAVAAPVARSVVEPKPVAQAPAPVATPAPVVAAAVKPAPLYTSAELNSVITTWARAWSSKDLNAYINHYVADFKGTAGSAPRWRVARGDMFKAARKIDLEVGQPTYTQLSANTVQADFSQRYASGIYKDNGSKRMTLVKADGQWKIASEVFTRGK